MDFIFVPLSLVAAVAGYHAGRQDEKARHRVLHTYTARASGYIMTQSCRIAIGRLTAAVADAGGKIQPEDIDGPFTVRQQSGGLVSAAVVKFLAPGDFKAPDGWTLYKDR